VRKASTSTIYDLRLMIDAEAFGGASYRRASAVGKQALGRRLEAVGSRRVRPGLEPLAVLCPPSSVLRLRSLPSVSSVTSVVQEQLSGVSSQFSVLGSPLKRSVRRFPSGMLIFMKHIGFVKRLFMEVRPPAAAAGGDDHRQQIASLPRRQWDYYELPWQSLKPESSSWRRSGAESSCLQPHTLQKNALRRHYERGQNAQNEPNFVRRRRAAEGIVQNEAKLGRTGVCGQTRLSCGAWLGPGVKRAKRTQFGAGSHAIADCGLKDAGRNRTPQANVQNEPNSARPRARAGGKRAKRTQLGPARPRASEGKCAKRTQFGLARGPGRR
jgi:hypothetical protein